MIHLSDEQFEEVLQGTLAEPPHVSQCKLCAERLAELKALRSRLHSAFTGIHASPQLLERIRRQVRREAVPVSPAVQRAPSKTIVLSQWLMPLAAAAAIILISIPAVLFFTATEPAMAGPAELYEVYQHSLSPRTELYSDADPAALAGFLKDELGFTPAVPQLGAGMSIRGCCVTHFRDKPVGSYVVDTPEGVISIIVVNDTPESLGMTESLSRGEHTYLAGSFAMCNMVTATLNGYTYCAVGEVSKDRLADLLERLVW